MQADPAMEQRPVFFFDIDNCLYSKGKQISEMMGTLIENYFMTHLSMTREDANVLHKRYYRDYGLAIEGLVRHHRVDPLEYNAKVDDALPLEDVLSRDEKLRSLLQDLDRTKIKPWLFTNAYINHGKRVVSLLGVEDMFEGITYCDYGAKQFISKPHPEKFAQAQREAGAQDPDQCFFVDDSAMNCRAAHELGWHVAHYVESDEVAPVKPVCEFQIRSLEELRRCFPQVFLSSTSGKTTESS